MTETRMMATPDTTGIKVHIAYREPSSAGATADVFGLDATGTLRPVRSGLVLPSGEGSEKASLDVPPGDYLVQTRFPTGEILNTPITVTTGATSYLAITPPQAPTDAGQADSPDFDAAPWLSRVVGEPGGAANAPADAGKPAVRAGTGSPSIGQLGTILLATHSPAGKPTGLDYLTEIAGNLFPETAGDDSSDILNGIEPKVEGSQLEFLPRMSWPSPTSAPAPSTPCLVGCVDGDNAWAAQVPPKWRAGSGSVGYRIVFYRNERPGVAILPRDPEMAALLEFLRRGDLTASHDLVLSAANFLFTKGSNPWAAAAGALALVQNRRWNPKARLTPAWTEWIASLAAHYPEVPDGPILHAWVTALDNSERADRRKATDDARRQLRQVLERAIAAPLPVFCGTFRLLIDGLKLTADLATVPDNAARAMRLPSLRLDPRQVFTTFWLTHKAEPDATPWPSSRNASH